MKIYQLIRIEDMSGVSGVGHIADCIEFDNGKVVVSWRGDVNSIAVYDSLDMAKRIHGHGGKTEFKESKILVFKMYIKYIINTLKDIHGIVDQDPGEEFLQKQHALKEFWEELEQDLLDGKIENNTIAVVGVDPAINSDHTVIYKVNWDDVKVKPIWDQKFDTKTINVDVKTFKRWINCLDSLYNALSDDWSNDTLTDTLAEMEKLIND